MGGDIYLDTINSLIISRYDSDINGLSIFNYLSQKVELEMKDFSVYPIDFYILNNRIIFTGKEEKEKNNSTWEIELEQSRIMQIDINTNELLNYKLFPIEDFGETARICN